MASSQNPVSVTETGAFRNCRRKHAWRHIDGHGMKVVVPALWLGSSVHYTLEKYYLGGQHKEILVEKYDDSVRQVVDELCQQFNRNYVLGEIDKDYKLGKAICANYGEWIENEAILPWTIVDVERRWRHVIDDSLPALTGRSDLLIRDENDELWVVDHKTLTQKPWEDAIALDDQITAYCYLVYKCTGEMPAGAIYNVLLKKMPKSFFSYTDLNGRSFYVPQGGWSDFFVRYPSPRTPEEIESYEERAFQVLTDIKRTREDRRLAYPSPSTWNCRGCDYRLPCKAKEMQDEVEVARLLSDFSAMPPRDYAIE